MAGQGVTGKVIIIGAGLAGMVAALSARQEGAGVMLVDMGSLALGTNSALSNGVFACPTQIRGRTDYIRDTIDVGRHINSRAVVERTAVEASQLPVLLRSLGVEVGEFSTGFRAIASSPGTIPGMDLVHRVAARLGTDADIKTLMGLSVLELVRADEGVTSVRGINRQGEEVTLTAPATILATGGAGAIYLRNDNQKTAMGQGYYLAAMAGLPLLDMEFVQFYPFVIAEQGLPALLVYPPHPREARIINDSGENILGKLGIADVNEALIKKRDTLSNLIMEEARLGPVYLDLRSVPAARWTEHPLSILGRLKFDFSAKPVRVAPAAHFVMGGLKTDECAATSLEGLYACGEVTWGLHGANRMGGNALTECVVTGRIAGRNAARRAATGKMAAGIQREERQRQAPEREDSEGSLSSLRRRIREVAWTDAGVAREKTGLRKGSEMAGALWGELETVAATDPSKRKIKADLTAAVFTLRAILAASLARQESRGSFLREDFPGEDDGRWLKNSCLLYDRNTDTFSVSHLNAE
jgi:fumarate reductase (CoM/CoB) subunit A